jgi:hypothetical protein
MSYADPDAHWVISRAIIRMPYVPETLAPLSEPWPVVTPRSPVRLRRIAEQLARQFTRETRFDPIYSASDPAPAVVLLPSRDRLIGGARLIAGAIGIGDFEEGPGAGWVYVHPYERGRGLVDDAWPFVTERWPGIRLAGPFTPAGAALRDRLEGAPE